MLKIPPRPDPLNYHNWPHGDYQFDRAEYAEAVAKVAVEALRGTLCMNAPSDQFYWGLDVPQCGKCLRCTAMRQIEESGWTP